MAVKAELWVLHCWEGAISQKTAVVSWPAAGKDSFLEPPEEMCPCGYLDVSTIRRLSKVNMCCFQPLNLCSSVTEAIGYWYRMQKKFLQWLLRGTDPTYFAFWNESTEVYLHNPDTARNNHFLVLKWHILATHFERLKFITSGLKYQDFKWGWDIVTALE